MDAEERTRPDRYTPHRRSHPATATPLRRAPGPSTTSGGTERLDDPDRAPGCRRLITRLGTTQNPADHLVQVLAIGFGKVR
ncbi:hypothetical protein [Streptomyces sp. NPDC088789]|uniref:hypothetical protein n=1 Tax=Streptomyces sp. NPDC088789 TaxID=3365899 RepID=UPI0038303C1C